MEYDIRMLEPEEGYCPFERWFVSLRDKQAVIRVHARLIRLRNGNVGDTRSVGGSVNELRIDYGPGYRVYFAVVAGTIIVLISGGDKSTQQRDIVSARKLWKENKDAAEKFQRGFRFPA